MEDNVVFFKNQQANDDMWSQLEQEAKGTFVLAGVPTEVLTAAMERMRRMHDTSMTIIPNFTFQPIVELTQDQTDLLAKQLESHFREQCWPFYFAKILLTAVTPEVVGMEVELYRLRNETGGKVS